MRKECKVKLKSIPTQLRDEWGAKISSKISQLINILELNSFPKNFLIGAYAPLKEEVAWNARVAHLSERLAFPFFLEEGKMDFRHCSLAKLMVSSDFGATILTPPKEAEVVMPSLLLVPGLGFSKDGKRLGRGAGYYDRYLENYAGLKVGLCFEQMIGEDIPTDSHDEYMDLVMTEKSLFVVKPGLEFLRREKWT